MLNINMPDEPIIDLHSDDYFMREALRQAAVFCRAIAKIARSQCLRLRQSWARRIFPGRRCRHAGGAHRHGGGAHRAAAAGPAGLRHRRGRRRPQPHPDGDAGAASRARRGSKLQPRSAGRRMRSKPRPLRSSPYGRCADCRSPFRPPPACRGRCRVVSSPFRSGCNGGRRGVAEGCCTSPTVRT